MYVKYNKTYMKHHIANIINGMRVLEKFIDGNYYTGLNYR